MGNEPTGSAPCKKHCGARAFYIEIRGLKKENEKLRCALAKIADYPNGLNDNLTFATARKIAKEAVC